MDYGYKVVEIWWLSGIKNFVSEKNDFIYNPFSNFKPVKRCLWVMARQHAGTAVFSEEHALWSRRGGCTAWEIIITVSIRHSQALHRERHSVISSK